LKVDIFNIPKKLAPRILNSASDYIIVDQCLRRLLRYGRHGELSGDLAAYWQIADNNQTFAFHIDLSIRFSNGEAIQVSDIVESLNHPDLRKNSIHFDFDTIASITAEGAKVVIRLKYPNPNFLYHLVQPEFGVFHSSDRGTKPPTLKITSGPYTLEEADQMHVILKKSPAYPHGGPDWVEFVALGPKKFEALEAGTIDMSLLSEDPTPEFLERIRTSKRFDMLRPHVGYTFWISLNPESKTFANKDLRQSFQKALYAAFEREFEPTFSWSMANQLYFPQGPGRIPRDWTREFWDKQAKVKAEGKQKISALLSSKFQFSQNLQKCLLETASAHGLQLDIETYADQAEFAEKLKQKNWDLYLINNDYSSLELVKSLVVTFNREKPLVKLASTDAVARKLWSDIQTTSDNETKHTGLEALGRHFLEEALIVPLLYKEVPIIKDRRVDLSQWSQFFPEFTFSKVVWNEAP